MRRRKKEGYVFLSLIIIMALCSISAFISDKGINANNTKQNTKNNAAMTLSYNRNGVISYEENDYFRKYTINCNKEIDYVNYSDVKDTIDIYLDKSEINNINVNGSPKKDSYYVSEKSKGSEVILSFNKKYSTENYVYVDKRDKKKIIILISNKKNPYEYKVMLDPGHGGNDIGTSYGNTYEKDLAFNICNYMVDELRYNGCEVFLTRNMNSDMELHERPVYANSQGADAFVSVHINSNLGKEFKGVSTYYYDPDGFESEERKELAEGIQSNLLKEGIWNNMGVSRQNFAVLRLSKMPSALVECGFLTNDDDRKKLLKDETQENIADSISNGIINFLYSKHGQ